MADRIPAHTHCQVCMKSIPVEEKFCSEECKEKFLSFQRKRKLINYFMLGLIAAAVVAIVLLNP